MATICKTYYWKLLLDDYLFYLSYQLNVLILSYFFEYPNRYIVGTGFFDVYVDNKLVNTLGPGSLFGELALLFAAPRNATIVLRTDEEASDAESEDDDEGEGGTSRTTALVENVLWRIHRETFDHVMNIDSTDLGVVETLKKQFSVDASCRRHQGHQRKHQHRKHNNHKSHIATPGQLELSKDQVNKPIIDSYALRQCAAVLNDSLLLWGVGKNKIKQMKPSMKWKWCIRKVLYQKEVEKTKIFLKKKYGSTGLVRDRPTSECENAPPKKIAEENRDWDKWLENELNILKKKLINNAIDEGTYERRRTLLENRWSLNI
jgi:hypothetical protein